MKKIIQYLAAAVFTATTLFSCVADDDTPTPGGGGNNNPNATINSYSGVSLTYNSSGNYASFINLSTGSVYNLNQAPLAKDNQARIDLVFWYNGINHTDPYLGAPTEVGSNSTVDKVIFEGPNGTSTWTTLNNTFLDRQSEISTADFAAVVDFASLNTMWSKSDFGDNIYGHYEYNVQSDRVYRFKTYDNKIGLIKINTIVGAGNSQATMQLDIKVQK